MQIVNHQQFMAMPAGTVYQKYEPQVFYDMAVKGDNCGEDDWFYSDLVPSIEDDAPVFEHCICRDGVYDEDQLFAVWSPDDVALMVALMVGE